MSIETMTKLATTTLGSNTVGVTFSNIPQGYTDLVVRISVRTNGTTTPYLYARFNGSSTDYSNRRIVSDGSAISSSAPSDAYIICGFSNTTDQTANTFSSVNLYIPNYSGNNFKSVSSEAAAENNATAARQTLFASLWSNSSAINSISFTDDGSNSFVTHSTFTLYGVKALRTAVGNGGAAYGGSKRFDGTYFYHTFTSTDTFVVTKPLTVDYLVVAGGGGGGAYYGAGGGAGGLRSTVTASGGSPGTVESALSLTAGTAYTVTVGAGGTGGIQGGTKPTQGGDSVFSTITSTGGGLAGGNHSSNRLPGNGGSGGGSRDNDAAGTGTASQGFAGGVGSSLAGGGGGGAGAVGTSIANNNAANGGAGVAVAISGSSVTYAGGGGNGGDVSSSGGVGGGGGRGVAGTANTGGGGGGGTVNGLAGGSGVVVIRYRAIA